MIWAARVASVVVLVGIACPARADEPPPALPPPTPAPLYPPAPAPPPPPPVVTEAAPVEEPYEPGLRDNVVGFYSGLQIGISPGIAFSTNTGKLAFNLGLGVGYGIEAGPVVLIPNVHGSLLLGAGQTVLAGMPGVGVVLPLGPVGVRVEAGVGPGYETQSGKTAVAYRALAALSIHPTRRTAIGLGAEYTVITAADIALIGPVLIIAF